MYQYISFVILLGALVTQAYAVVLPRSSFSLANGQEAQSLNAQFAALDGSSACDEGEKGCLNGAFALCQDGNFVTSDCQDGTSCFAVPLVSSPGTSIVCDDESDALARIANTGATGGLTGMDD